MNNPLACPETVQQTGQKHFRGEINKMEIKLEVMLDARKGMKEEKNKR